MKTSAKQMKQSMVEAGGINLGEEVVPRTVQWMRLNRNSGQVEEQTEAYLHRLRGCAKFCMNIC